MPSRKVVDEAPLTVADAAAGGDRRVALLALRDKLARSIDSCDSLRDLAALSARLTDVLAQIEALPDKAEVSAADEVAKRRAARRAGSARPSRAASPG